VIILLSETIQSAADILVVEKSNLTQSSVSTSGTCTTSLAKVVSKSKPCMSSQATYKQSGAPTPSVEVSMDKIELIMSNESVSSSRSSEVPVSTATVQSVNAPTSLVVPTSNIKRSNVVSSTRMNSVSAASSAMTSLDETADLGSASATTSTIDVSLTPTVNRALVDQQLYCVCRTPYDETKLVL